MEQDKMLPVLLSWYRRNARDLPWRRNREPYRVMVSEFMLVQTTVATVAPRYGLFLKKFPTLAALAKARLPSVLAAWSGLGYYSRAKNLWLAAKEIEGRGSFPKTAAQLEELPGFGPYLAAAVSSFSFNERVPVLDTNVRRVLERIFQSDPREALDRFLESPYPPRQINEGLMELGALVCRAKSPLCQECPVFQWCRTKGEGKGAQPRIKPEAVELAIDVHRDKKGRYLLVQRGAKELFLKNVWGLPVRRLNSCLKSGSQFRHSIMRYRIHAHVFYFNGGKRAGSTTSSNQWVAPEKLKKYLFSSLWWKALSDPD